MLYEVKVRNDSNGEKMLSPFIDGFNVWDIPPREYTVVVEQAIQRAFEIGRRSVNTEIALCLGAGSDIVTWERRGEIPL